MASESKRVAVEMTGAFIDITSLAGFTDLANADVTIQSISTSTDPIQVIFGGADTPTEYGGFWLFDRGAACRGTAANIWVRGPVGARLTATKEA